MPPLETLPVMQTEKDCGPVVVLGALQTIGIKMTRENLLRLWKWQEYGDLREDLQDSPWHHFAVLKRLNVPWMVRTCGDIKAGRCQNGRTAMLIHWPAGPYQYQHWVLLAGVSTETRHVWVYLGNGKTKAFTFTEFDEVYAGGSPACAYEVGVGSCGLTWFQRFYVWLFDCFC